MPDSTPCTWAEDEDGIWVTACGNMFEITHGSPYTNSMEFCAYCGRRIHEVSFSEPDYDEDDPSSARRD